MQERDSGQGEIIEFLHELDDRLPRYARRAAAIKGGDQYSVEWFAEIGKFIRDAREGAGIDRKTMSTSHGINITHIRLLEVGLGEPDELPLASAIMRVLGGEELLQQFEEKFKLGSTKD